MVLSDVTCWWWQGDIFSPFFSPALGASPVSHGTRCVLVLLILYTVSTLHIFEADKFPNFASILRCNVERKSYRYMQTRFCAIVSLVFPVSR